ncbi:MULTISPECIES: site-specific integrase [unclassified Actinoplanes]|uniref:tyrosine-type recombinase/integrase n=1 Tax=unclassified Actinoplanes TaxID=2626549 RepID=UPI001E4C21A4|nr:MULTISPECIES: site-specific integrase [unclassified Actinoplanes]
MPGADGRQKRLRRGGFSSRAEAERGLAEVLELPGPEAMAETWTVKRWLEFWLSQIEDRVRPSTVRAYRSVTYRHLVPWLGRYRVAELDGRRGAKLVQRAVDGIGRQEKRDGDLVAASTVHRVVAVLRSALSEARRQGLVSSNAAWRLRLPTGARPQAVAWTREREALWRATGARPRVAVWDVENVAKFLEAVEGDPLFPLWWLVALRGLRRGEVAALRAMDLNAEFRELSVERQLLIVDGKVRLGPPKSAAGVRVLALDEFTNQLLRQHRDRQQARFAGTDRNPRRYLFTHADGRPVRPDWLTHRFHALVAEFGLPPVRFHDLRHGAASLAGAAGVELKVIQHDLGHSSAVTTADTYWTVFRELADRAVAATAGLLRTHARIRLNLGAASQA